MRDGEVVRQSLFIAQKSPLIFGYLHKSRGNICFFAPEYVILLLIERRRSIRCEKG